MSERVRRVLNQLNAEEQTEETGAGRESLSVVDNRNGKEYELGITNGTLNAKEVQKIKLEGAQVGLRVYDPGYTNTCAATSRITYIDGPNGLLTYRGYPIEQLAKNSTFLETAFLLLYGNLPSEGELNYFTERVMRHTNVHEDLAAMMKSFRYGAHPMGMLATSVC